MSPRNADPTRAHRAGRTGIGRTLFRLLPTALALSLAAAPAVRGEEPSLSIELELKPPATAARALPLPPSETVKADTAEAISELRAQERLDELIRETLQRPRRRPDLDYDVFSGIQSRGISNALRQR